MRQQKSFLLKFWNDSADIENWRASLENVRDKEKVYFADLEKLQEGIETLIGLNAEARQELEPNKIV